jgi:hypothetical protein
MKSLQGKNILTFHSKKLHVPDPDRLAVMANHNHNFFVLKAML